MKRGRCRRETTDLSSSVCALEVGERLNCAILVVSLMVLAKKKGNREPLQQHWRSYYCCALQANFGDLSCLSRAYVDFTLESRNPKFLDANAPAQGLHASLIFCMTGSWIRLHTHQILILQTSFCTGPFRIIRMSVIRLLHCSTFFQNRFGLVCVYI